MNSVFVLSSTKKPLMPCRPARARQLLTAGRVKRVNGFSTGDIVKLVQPAGKYAGTYVARLAGIRVTGMLDIKTTVGSITASFKNFTLIQRNDGFDYAAN